MLMLTNKGGHFVHVPTPLIYESNFIALIMVNSMSKHLLLLTMDNTIVCHKILAFTLGNSVQAILQSLCPVDIPIPFSHVWRLSNSIFSPSNRKTIEIVKKHHNIIQVKIVLCGIDNILHNILHIQSHMTLLWTWKMLWFFFSQNWNICY